MMKIISDDDIAALQAVRSVIADAVSHPGQQAAIEAIDRLGKPQSKTPPKSAPAWPEPKCCGVNMERWGPSRAAGGRDVWLCAINTSTCDWMLVDVAEIDLESAIACGLLVPDRCGFHTR